MDRVFLVDTLLPVGVADTRIQVAVVLRLLWAAVAAGLGTVLDLAVGIPFFGSGIRLVLVVRRLGWLGAAVVVAVRDTEGTRAHPVDTAVLVHLVYRLLVLGLVVVDSFLDRTVLEGPLCEAAGFRSFSDLLSCDFSRAGDLSGGALGDRWHHPRACRRDGSHLSSLYGLD